MSRRLKSRDQIRKLACGLGLGRARDPAHAIVDWCERRVRTILKEFPHCTTPAQLLEVLANKLGTEFQVVRTDAELRQLQHRYVSAGERAFARLAEEFADEVYGITFRRMRRKFWEPEFVSVIDSRGEKVQREYYTKWHEVGHLLMLPDAARLSFRRTHWADANLKGAEESIVDMVAATFAFCRPLKRGRRQLFSFSKRRKLPHAGPGSKLCGN